LPELARIVVPVTAACVVTAVAAILFADAGLIVRLTVVSVFGTALLYVFRAIRAEDFVYAYRLLSTRSARDNQ
jgi:adenylylsulfate kinase-like enzyme